MDLLFLLVFVKKQQKLRVQYGRQQDITRLGGLEVVARLVSLRLAIDQGRPELNNRRGVVFHQDNARPHTSVRLFRGTIGADSVFIDDNARPLRTTDIQQLLENEDISRMDWPAFSPDLNLIEHAWEDLGRHLAARLHSPGNTQKLKHMLIDEWALSYI
ncbi:transposable element Tcb2 transposase [Trichonephila clavipes]|uniref:Transposable element Tcb2 transposase n=1 Tax=Trichonephila clavipes TaxID=2585209 RepID=A0A8X6S209_TRICX|nr:transposable element Tcb2 transposase [Trichonephila clavipes]